MTENVSEAGSRPLPHYARKALDRPRDGKILCRTSSDTEEAVMKGGGFVFFTEPDHRPFPPASAVLLIEGGYVSPQDDGLLPGVSQTFVVRDV